MNPTSRSQTPFSGHLKWLVESRKLNQEVSAHLYELTAKPECWEDTNLGYDAKTLIGIGFSL